MYAIIETGGKQYWVSTGDTLRVEKLTAAPGDSIEFPALWTAEESKADSGSQKGKVKAQVVRQLKDAKILVFKKRPKSRYRRTKGHRQEVTEIRITDISLN